MGKYKNSDIHNKYSDWHWQLSVVDDKYKTLYCADIDRLWIEYDFKRQAVIAVFDIKYEYSGDSVTTTEKGIYDWFISKGVRVFVVYINREFTSFRVVNEKGEQLRMDALQYAEFLYSMRDKRLFIECLSEIKESNKNENGHNVAECYEVSQYEIPF